MGTNPEFTSELLRINGLLQTSITELRYRCEVYRLSLRSICRTLAIVQREQEGRLRCLTTCRPSYQSYLLNLSQKLALERIGMVVRKASTFINGYALVDKRQFQPPPPKPESVQRNKKKVAFCTTTSTNEPTDSITHEAGDGHVTKAETARGEPTSSHRKGKAEASSRRKKRSPSVRSPEKEKSRERGKERKSKSMMVSSFSSNKSEMDGGYKRGGDRIRNASKPRTNEKGRDRHSNRSSLRFRTLKEREEEKQRKLSSKSITCHRFQVINPRTRYQDNSGNRGFLSAAERRRAQQSSAQGRSGESRNLGGKTFTYHANKDSWRAEARRRPSKEQPARGRRETSSGSHRTDRADERKGSNIRTARLKEIQGSKSTTRTTRYKVRESLALVRHHQRGKDSTASASQGQGVPRKYLCSTQQRQNNFKLNQNIVGHNGMARRAVSSKEGGGEDDDHDDGDGDNKNSIHSPTQTESKNKSNSRGPSRSLSPL